MAFSNAKEIAARMKARGPAVIRELRKAARELAPELEAESKRILSKRIYSVPIPKRPRSGKPKWTRAGQGGGILAHEKARPDGVTVVMTNDSDHALARHALGTPEGRRIVSEGVQSVQWHTEAIAAKRPRILEVRRKAVFRALSSP